MAGGNVAAMLEPEPKNIFLQADAFFNALTILSNVDRDNEQLAVTIGEPVIVIGALTIELFLKCLTCIDIARVPRGHNLKFLYDGLSPSIRNRIQHGWDKEIVPFRSREWDTIEQSFGQKIVRDLPGALAAAGKAFERIRYSYEGNTADVQYFCRICHSYSGGWCSSLGQSGRRSVV